MNKNSQTETAQKGQAVNNIQTENAATTKGKSKTPTGKITLLKNTEARRKAREESYKNFRINALIRRATRMGYSEEQINELVKRLIEQISAPNQYTILVMIEHNRRVKKGEKQPITLFEEALNSKNIRYNYRGATYMSFTGDNAVLATIREIAPPGAKIAVYAQKQESVLKGVLPEKKKKPSNNTAEVKKEAKMRRKAANMRRASLISEHAKGISWAKRNKRINLQKVRARRKAKSVQLKGKTAATAKETVKKAA